MGCEKIYRRRRKKNDSGGNARKVFDELPDELKVEILRRIPTKIVADLAYVSKTWFRLITAYVFPKPTSTLPFAGLIPRLWFPSLRPAIRLHFFDITEGASVSRCLAWDSINPKASSWSDNHIRSSMSSCNGLYLFLCYKTAAIEAAATSPLETMADFYYVVNIVTGQRATVDIPGKTPFNRTYAALAYDPSESCFFKIIQFRGFRCLDVYNSETRSWNKLEYRLEYHVVMAEWVRQCVFFRGAVYRLSMSGHLLRFVVDRELPLMDQARAINLPNVANKHPKGCIGLSNDRIRFMAFDNELCLCIWVLSDDTYEWSLVCRLSKIHENCDVENDFCKPLGFHLYSDIVFVGYKSRQSGSEIMSIDFSRDISPGKEYLLCSLVTQIDCHIRWNYVVSYPFIYCCVPFAIGLGDNHTNHDGQRNSTFRQGIEEMLHKIKHLHNQLKATPLLLP